MRKYRIIVELEEDPVLWANCIKLLEGAGAKVLRFNKVVMFKGTLQKGGTEPLEPFDDEVDTSSGVPQEKTQRNADIVAKYVADPKVNSCGKLGVEYGVTRERICQILRKANVISKKQMRDELAREALAEEKDAIKTEINKAWEERKEEVIELIRQGKSIRQALLSVKLPPHSHMSNIIGRECRLRGINLYHGRHRDFSARKAAVKELWDTGLPIYKIVEKLRKEKDPHLNEPWVYRHMPELIRNPKMAKNARIDNG